jgi:hypothetical protein
MVKVVWEKVVEYDMPEDNFESVEDWHKSVVSRINNLPAMAGSKWKGNLGQREKDALRPALKSRFDNRKENNPTTLAGGGKALKNFIGEYKITLVSPKSVQNQMNTYYEMLDILNSDKKVTTTPPFITIEQEKGDVDDAIERALHYVLYTREKSVSPKKIVGIAMGFISPRYENLKSEMKNIPKKLVPRYIQLLKDYESVEGEDLKKKVLKKYSDIEKYTQSGPQTLSEPFEFYLVGQNIPITHFGFVIDDEPYEIELEKAIRLIRHDKAAIARLHEIKPGGPKHPPDEGGKYYFAISNDPVINITKSTTRYWEQGSCERAWTVGGHMHQGVYDDIKMGNPTLMVIAGHQPPVGWPDSQNTNMPSNPPKEGELLGRLTMRWGWREGIPANGIGIGPDSSIYGMRGQNNLKGVTNNIILALMQIARANQLSDYERLGFKSPCSKTGANYSYGGSADAGNMRGGNLTYQGKGKLKEGVEINFDLEAAQAEGIQYGALNRVSRPNIDISIRRILSLNNGIWAIEGGEECIARLIMAKDQQLHLNLAGNVNAHPEALMLLAQTMYETFPDLTKSYLQANTIDKIILSNPNCTPEIIDWIKKNHQGYVVSAGSIVRRNKRVPNDAKITPFEITNFGFGQTQMQSFYRNIMTSPKSYTGGYMPSSLILNSLTTANIDKILKTLNKVKYNSPMVLGYMTFERTNDSRNEGKKYLEQLESPDICPLATLVMPSPFNSSTIPQKEKFAIRMQKFYYAHLYETIVLMHLLCAPNLSNKQYCDIIKRIREGLLETRRFAEINEAYKKQTNTAISNKLSDVISRTRRLSIALFNFALALYVTPFNNASDWGYDSIANNKSFKRPFLDNAFWADSNPTLKEGLFSGALGNKAFTLKLKSIPFTFKLPNDDLILCKDSKQSVNSAKLIFELVRDILPKATLMTTTNYDRYESPYEFLLGLTQTKEVYMALWKSRNKLQIPIQAFGYSCLKPDFLQIGYDKKNPIYNTFYNQTMFDAIMKEYGKDAFVKEHILEYALSPALLTRLAKDGEGTKPIFAGYGTLPIKKRGSNIRLLQVEKTDPITKQYLKSNMDKMEDPVFFLNHSNAIKSRILPEMNAEEAQKIADEYLHYTFNACLGNLYSGTKENSRSISNFTKAKTIKDLYAQTDYSFAFKKLSGALLGKLFEGQISDELQKFFLAEIYAIADMYDLEVENQEVILDDFMEDYFLTNPNSSMSEYVYMKCYSEGKYLHTLAKHKDTPIEIITELFADYPVEVLQNPKLPKRVFNRLFKATETILKAPIGEDKFRLKTSLTSANVKQKNDAYKNQNTLSMLLRSDRKGVNKRADVRRFIESFPYIQYWRGGNEKKGVFNTIERQNIYTEGIADEIIMPDSPAFWIIALDDVEREYQYEEYKDEEPFTIKGARFHYVESIEETAGGYSVTATTWANCPSAFPLAFENETKQNYTSTKTFNKDEIHQLFYKKKENKEGEPRWEVDMLFVLEDSEFEKLANQAEYPDWRYTWSQDKSHQLMQAFIERSDGKSILNKINEMTEEGKYIVKGKPNDAGVSKQMATYGISDIIINLAVGVSYLWTPSLWDACAEHLFTHQTSSSASWRVWLKEAIKQGDFKMTKLFKSLLLAESKKELGELGYPAISEDLVAKMCYNLMPILGQLRAVGSGPAEAIDSWFFKNPEFVAELEHHVKMLSYEINNYDQERVKAQQAQSEMPLPPPYYNASKGGFLNQIINSLQNMFFITLETYMNPPLANSPATYIKNYNDFKPIREAYNKRANQLRKNAPYIQTKEGGANLTPNLQQVANIRDNQ